MGLLILLWHEQRARFILTTALLLTHTILNIAFISFIGSYTIQLQNPPYPLWQLLVLITCIVGAQLASMLIAGHLAYQISSLLRTRLLAQIAMTPLIVLEQIGKSRVSTSFIDDAERIRASLQLVMSIARDLCLVAGIFIYLAVLSPKLTLLTLLFLAIGTAIFRPLRERGLTLAARHREASDDSFALVNDLLDGIKQLKCDAKLRLAAATSMQARLSQVEQSGSATNRWFSSGIQSSILLYFGLFLLITYARLDDGMASETMAIFVVGLMLILTPLVNAGFVVQQIDMANVSLARIDRLLAELQCDAREFDSTPVATDGITTLELRSVCHTYRTGEREEFTLGPVSIIVAAGQSLFIVGGNGTGKTTLLKIITGLYAPASGDVCIDGRAIDDARRPWLRHQFSAVFSDSCLFESLRESPFDLELSAHSASMLEALRLNQAVNCNRTLLAQASSCSGGERRRILFLLARLADRPIYVFDEFAADQDPANKELFYDQIIPMLKRRGKIVIAITHDERYFDRADHLLVLDRGLAPVVHHKSSLVVGGTFTT